MVTKLWKKTRNCTILALNNSLCTKELSIPCIFRTFAVVLQPLCEAATQKAPGRKFADIWQKRNLDTHYKVAQQLLIRAIELVRPKCYCTVPNLLS